MSAAVLCIGTEITRGEIVNTNATWLCDTLTSIGFEVTEVASIDDDRPRIIDTLLRLSRDHEVIACTGGLGPTTDDLTTEAVGLAAGLPLVRDPPTVAAIQDRFRRLGRALVASNLKQADFPSGSTILTNAVGTAPGFGLRIGKSIAFFFPGVPMELKRIWQDHVDQVLREMAPRCTYQLRLRTFGQPESTVGQMLDGVEQAHPGVIIGYRASFPEIEIKILARGVDLADAKSRSEAAAIVVRERLGAIVHSEGTQTLVGAVAAALRATGGTLALAESCTGGLVAHMLTSEPASDYLLGAMVTYSNEIKTALLGVPAETLQTQGAVSREVAIAMAQGALRATSATHSIAITGIAGPTGGTAEKPVGLVHWAVAHPGGVQARDRVFVGDRGRIQRMAAFASLDLLRRIALGSDQ
ncbi:MAG: CinA family nicotinamide mononucleotide deamidase-related protein [Deltaproteobacteria bacterium]|nr:CinA family nicotinamide mononucleotide deamidase-related protein [Deltaproteobacteria bacterium]